MESSDEEGQNRDTLMEEAIRILNQEGFKLPGDVVDTLQTVGRSNAAARRRGSLRSHKLCEVKSNEKKVRNTRESSARRNRDRSSSTDRNEPFNENNEQQTEEPANQKSQEGEQKQSSTEESAQRNKLEREESTESSSTCSASTVKEMKKPDNERFLSRQDSGSSIESSASSMNKKRCSRLESVGSDTGYNTSIENVVQTREAKAENLRNMNKAIDNDMTKYQNNGLKRDISRDSGFTEPGYNQQLLSNDSRDAQAMTTQDFHDVSISKSDVSERFAASDHGEAHVVTSSATDLTAAQMTSKGDAVTDDGTAVSSTSNLENQESNSTLLRVTNKRTDEEVSKEDDYESVNRTTKSSKTDSVSTDALGISTVASRHAASIEQGLYKERSKLLKSQDGTRIGADMSVDQQLSRNQEMNNTEESEDGSTKVESKKTSEKALTSKALKEEKIDSADGSLSGTVSSSLNMDSSTRSTENDETITTADGRKITKRQNSLTSSMNETSSSEKKTVKQLPYGGGSSTEIVKKSDSSSVSQVSKVRSERTQTSRGIMERKEEEDNKSMSSSFSGKCESEENVNGLKLKRTQSTEKSSESNVKSNRSTFSNRGDGYSCGRGIGRQLSEESDLSNYSGLSKDSIKPPSYDETMSNLSRHDSHGSLNSVFSRQDSSASSIASSAGAFNERQRLKELEKERNRSFEGDLRRTDNSVNYSGRPSGTARQDSYSSDSTISAGDMYEGREVVHPIRKTDANVYGRSLTDSVIGQSVNRRATLLGDVILTERDVQRARDDIQRSYRGRDDSYVGKSSGRFENGRSHRRDDFDDFGGFGAGSFKNEVMDMVDKFFDEDDDFNFGFGSGKRRSNGTRLNDRNLSSKRREENPYTVRDDLSKYRGSVDSVNANLVRTDYAASDSGYPVGRQRRNLSELDEFDSSFSDVASDTGHNRFSRHHPGTNNYSRRNDFSDFDSRASSRVNKDENYRYSHLSDRNSAVSADDILQRAGKSIRSDREFNASVSDRIDNNKHKRINNYNVDSRNENRYHNRREGDYSRLGDNTFDMNDEENRCGSVNSMPNNSCRSQTYQPDEEEFYTSSLPNLSSSGKGQGTRRQQHSSELCEEDKQHWNDRRKRIDKALTWIRSELVSNSFSCLFL